MLYDFLFEIGVEELPSGSVQTLAQALTTHFLEGLAEAHIHHGAVRSFATPRRLAVLVRDVSSQQPEQHLSKRGPNVNANAAAVQGFATSCGVTPDALTTLTTEKGSWWAYEAILPGAATLTLLPAILETAVNALPIAKPMRWGHGEHAFARPVHWVVALLGDQVVPMTLLGQTAQRQTYGHRFHHPEAVDIISPLHYEEALHQAHVIAHFETRRQTIVDQIQHQARPHQAIMPEALLDEVTSIVEWPCTLRATIDPRFLDVPAEALIAAMQVHQKCFALRDEQGCLVPTFLTVANIQSKHPHCVKAGNEKVMHARLSDAAFFYHQDKKHPLSQALPALSNMVFQEKLGSLADKTSRLQRLMQTLTPLLNLDAQHADRAAMLSKCDLLSGMVGEFPELQGIMGSYYALAEGESAAVALAIREHELPRFSADDLPTSSLGLALSLADRIDTLVGIFAIGLTPRGVKDPFKLRRHAHAVIRLLLAMKQPLSLSALLHEACHAYPSALTLHEDKIVDEVQRFILERLPAYYQAQEIDASVVLAVRASQEDMLFDMDQRIQAVLNLLQSTEGRTLVALSKRVNHLLDHAAFDEHSTLKIDETCLTEDAEKTLYAHLLTLESNTQFADNYTQRLTNLATLSAPIEVFFANVMVMTDDLKQRQTRLSLLKRVQTLIHAVANLAYLSSELKS